MQNLQSHAQKDLKRLVEQIERLEAEKKALAGDVSDKFNEAKSKGLDPRIIRKVLALRKLGEKRAEEEALIATYMHALEGTPLGDYADRVHEVGKAHGYSKSIREKVIAEAAE